LRIIYKNTIRQADTSVGFYVNVGNPLQIQVRSHPGGEKFFVFNQQFCHTGADRAATEQADIYFSHTFFQLQTSLNSLLNGYEFINNTTPMKGSQKNCFDF
jgi:hypothetical protein